MIAEDDGTIKINFITSDNKTLVTKEERSKEEPEGIANAHGLSVENSVPKQENEGNTLKEHSDRDNNATTDSIEN